MSVRWTMAVVAATLTAAPLAHPSVRAWATDAYRSVVQVDKERDPVGFVSSVERELRPAIEELSVLRRELLAEQARLDEIERGERAGLEHGRKLLSDCRKAYQGGVFPVEVCGRAYTQSQLEEQAAGLLVETQGRNETLTRLVALQQMTREKLKILSVQIHRMETHLAMLPAKRQVIAAGQQTDDSAQSLAEVDRLLQGREELITGNPVRELRELITAAQRNHGFSSEVTTAREFLVGDAALREATATTVAKPGVPAFSQE